MTTTADNSTSQATTANSNVSGPKRLNYTHEAMVDLIIQEPTVSSAELAELFGFSQGWIQKVLISDAFQSRLAERKSQLVDPHIANSLNERLRGVTIKAIDLIDQRLSTDESNASFALEALGIASGGLFGAAGKGKR